MPNTHNLAQKRLTRESIIEALLDLMRRKPLERISVSELCGRAGVSRMAFYRHFDTMQEVLKGHFRDQQSEFLGWLRRHPGLSLYEIGSRFLEIIQREKRIYRATFTANLQWILVDYMVSGVEQFRMEFRPLASRSDTEKEYVIAYEAGGFLSIISKWLDRNCRDPKEDILAILFNGYEGF